MRVVAGCRLGRSLVREPRLDLPIGVPARNWVLVVNGSWVGLLDQIHSAGGLTFPGTPRSLRGFLRRL